MISSAQWKKLSFNFNFLFFHLPHVNLYLTQIWGRVIMNIPSILTIEEIYFKSIFLAVCSTNCWWFSFFISVEKNMQLFRCSLISDLERDYCLSRMLWAWECSSGSCLEYSSGMSHCKQALAWSLSTLPLSSATFLGSGSLMSFYAKLISLECISYEDIISETACFKVYLLVFWFWWARILGLSIH